MVSETKRPFLIFRDSIFVVCFVESADSGLAFYNFLISFLHTLQLSCCLVYNIYWSLAHRYISFPHHQFIFLFFSAYWSSRFLNSCSLIRALLYPNSRLPSWYTCFFHLHLLSLSRIPSCLHRAAFSLFESYCEINRGSAVVESGDIPAAPTGKEFASLHVLSWDKKTSKTRLSWEFLPRAFSHTGQMLAFKPSYKRLFFSSSCKNLLAATSPVFHSGLIFVASVEWLISFCIVWFYACLSLRRIQEIRVIRVGAFHNDLCAFLYPRLRQKLVKCMKTPGCDSKLSDSDCISFLSNKSLYSN